MLAANREKERGRARRFNQKIT